ncbi:ROK family protein [Terrimonas pollutisoli]|uniref:ROK family protein n=1 Tax=Terrimonas pollutisoli TaxID=3034147 RepID=UPI0023EBA55E|nr:ROK family protein [Terrimonas sp. H1YJ31]
MIIGIDLGGTNVRAGLVDNGTILQIHQSELSEKNSLESTLQQLFSSISSFTNYNIEGIGIGVPSIVDTKKGIVYDVVNIPSWKKVDLKKILEDKFSIPTYVNNDVNCLALGEQLFGQASSFSSFVTIAIGTGLGAAIVIDHKLYEGVQCGSGEIGYIPYLDKNLEFYASGAFFETFSTTAHAAYQAAVNKDESALQMWSSYGHHLGQVMKVILYTYAPEAIFIGGSLSNAFSFFETSMYQSMSDFIYPGLLKQVRILPSSVKNIAILGAAAMAYSRQ